MKTKPSFQRKAAFAKGGKTPMFSKQAAGPDRPGNTGKDQSAAPGKRAAAGGPPTRGIALSKSAAAGRTAPPTKGR
jgi:hypothetical protein